MDVEESDAPVNRKLPFLAGGGNFVHDPSRQLKVNVSSLHFYFVNTL